MITRPFLRLSSLLSRSTRRLLFCGLLLLTLVAALWMTRPPLPLLAQDDAPASDTEEGTITGTVFDAQDSPVCEAEVAMFLNGSPDPIDTALTDCASGTYILDVPTVQPLNAVTLTIERAHYWPQDVVLLEAAVGRLAGGHALHVQDIALERRINASFWVASVTFVLVLALIAFEVLHNTLAALMGVAIVLVSSAASHFVPDLFVFDFVHALGFVDFQVIFLVMGMMIVIAAIEETGIFQWVTYQAYRLSRGRVWLLVVILMFITAIASALLDNVTTMLLMAPLTIQIGLALEVNPLSLLIPEVLASNVGGIATLIGTPTNILIGSYAGISFNDFLSNLTPGVLLAQVALIIFVVLRYRKGWAAAKGGGGLSPALLEKLAEQGQIRQPVKLRKAGIIFGVMMAGFILGEQIHLAPAVTALTGAVLMLLWVEPDIETMLQLVDWTTLMFFIALFILVGGIQEVGLLSVIAGGIANLIGDNVVAAVLVLTWSAALLSGVVANIPFTAAMLPVVEFLTRSISGATGNMLFYCLSVGSAMGGNSSLIGASANMVTAGIAERAGYRITYMDFLKVGFPATIITVAIGATWLLFHFGLLFGGG